MRNEHKWMKTRYDKDVGNVIYKYLLLYAMYV